MWWQKLVQLSVSSLWSLSVHFDPRSLQGLTTLVAVFLNSTTPMHAWYHSKSLAAKQQWKDPGNPDLGKLSFLTVTSCLHTFLSTFDKKVCKLSFGLTTWALFYVCTKKNVDKKYVEDIMLAYFLCLHCTCVCMFSCFACLLGPPLTVKLKWIHSNISATSA